MVQGVYQEIHLTASIILDSQFFDNFIYFHNLFAKTFVNNKLCGKLVSPLPFISDDNLKVMPVTFSAVAFNLPS